MALSGYQVPHGIYFLNKSLPALTVGRRRIKFSKACHEKLNYCRWVEILYHPIIQTIIIRQTTPDNPNCIEWEKEDVCFLQPQAHFYQNPSMGRIRFLDPYEKAGQEFFSLARHTGWVAKSISGADASAITYSIVETALLNGLKPYLYLTYVLERLRQLGSFPKPEELDSLLPWAKELPEEIKKKTKPKK